MTVLLFSSAAVLLGFISDMIFGDPIKIPHIVRLAGSLIAALEKILRKIFKKTPSGERIGGVFLVIFTALICTAVPFSALLLCYRFSPFLGAFSETVLCWQLLAAKSLKTESMKVYRSLNEGKEDEARKNLSMIVGRDTSVLSKDGIVRAAVETVAENASDGVAAPLFFIMLGGASAGCFYKAVNTMDSMVGYKNASYINFGRFAARTDDFFNFLPSRICVLLMILSSFLLRFNFRNAFRIWRRDRMKHYSPNSAQTESVCAGALGIRLGGPAVYFNEVKEKMYIGDDSRPVESEDIVRANRLMYASSFLMLAAVILFRAACLAVLNGTL